MIVAVTLSDDRIVSLSADHVLLMEPAEGKEEMTEVTMANGKKFVLKGNVLQLTHKFNVSR